ncbi:uncharacterized protein LOC144627941 [Oculina patagonica]
MASITSLSAILKNILEEEIVNESSVLSVEHCKVLLLSEESLSTLSTEVLKYPRYPLYMEISKKLYQWMENGEFPVKSEVCGLLTEGRFVEERKEIAEKVSPILKALKISWTEITDAEKSHQLTSVIKILGVRGLLDLLNIRHTQGSVDIFPPPLATLIASFNEKHKLNANLTVGARALSKHCHRDVTSEWWGACVGCEQAKNEHANTIVMCILGDASWINIHKLPHDLKVIEVRCAEGYGARWSYDGKVFRGFLEPQMEDGHAAGWKH